MWRRAYLLLILTVYWRVGAFAQDHYSYGGGNFDGLNQVIANPASAADNRLKLDILLGGFDLNFNNSWFSIKRSALPLEGKYTNPGSLVFPKSWENSVPNTPDNIFKNFNIIGKGKSRAILFENRIILPSFMVQLNHKNAIAFTWSVRQMMNLDGVSPKLAELFEHEMDITVVQNNQVNNKNLSAMQMSWAEYGLTYARVLKENNQHFLKAGITPKIIQGLEAAYLIAPKLEFFLSTKDTNSYFNSQFAFAHSANLGSPFANGRPVADFYHRVARPTMGLDIGVVYEWRPHYRDFKYKPDGKNLIWRKDLNKYKLRAGASITDIGKITFDTQGTSYAMDFSVTQWDILKLVGSTDIEEFNSIIRSKFPEKKVPPQFSIFLPMAFNTQVDYSLNKFFYLNLSTHLTGFHRSTLFRVHNYSSVCFAPRVEHYWFTLSVPFSINALSTGRAKYINTGVNLRLGPFSVGTSDLSYFLKKGDISSLNFYALVRFAIPYRTIRDRDDDGVKDKKDLCPDDKGEITLNGCPDKDHDNVADKDDACPNQPGLAAFKGCPDTDGDGIKDGDDACPDKPGSLAMKGCPDMDNDSIPDKDDACPDVLGLKAFKGCPDTDGDGIIDKIDFCPNEKGIAKHHGCPDYDKDGVFDDVDQCVTVPGATDNKGCPWPDTDKDGVIDKLDSCITVAGVAEYKGCPAPVEPVIAAVEKKILEKAYSNLEFETGKDIIKKQSYSSLKALAKLLFEHKDDWKLKLVGHTDNKGSEEKNMLLSEKRAEAVKKYLMKRGVPEEDFIVEWHGESMPIAPNDTKAGMKKNRRVEMIILMNSH